MIEMLKGLKYGFNGNEYTTLLMSYRDLRFEINNLIKKDAKPYIGAILDKKSAIDLRDWLNKVLEKSKQCDYCWNFKLPFNFVGEIICVECNLLIKSGR